MKKWFIAGAKRVGYQHEKAEVKLPCQDYFTIKGSSNLYAVALADGLGSAAHSEEGAEIATKVCTKLLLQNRQRYFSLKSPSEMIDEIIDEINRSLTEIAQAKDNKLDEYATTLMFALVDKENFILGHLGDGAIGSVNINDETLVISTEEKEREKNYTISVTARNANKSVRIFRGSLKDKIGFVLMSDGPYDVLIQNLPKNEKRMVSDVSDLFNLFKKNVNGFDKELEEYIEKNIYTNVFDDISLVFMLAQEIDSDYFSLSKEEKDKILNKVQLENDSKDFLSGNKIIENILNNLTWPMLKKELLAILPKDNESDHYEAIIDLLIKENFLEINKDEIVEICQKRSKIIFRNEIKKEEIDLVGE